ITHDLTCERPHLAYNQARFLDVCLLIPILVDTNDPLLAGIWKFCIWRPEVVDNYLDNLKI
ncbi:hypothetical protein BZG21_35320, partial [Escherichia coli]|nr:hypothetical protein [Escherichia coli]